MTYLICFELHFLVQVLFYPLCIEHTLISQTKHTIATLRYVVVVVIRHKHGGLFKKLSTLGSLASEKFPFRLTRLD